jgi:hypothetical protein
MLKEVLDRIEVFADQYRPPFVVVAHYQVA